MPVIPGLEWTFDEVTALYDAFRPGYCAAVFDDIFRRAGRGGRALEVGIGTGQATQPVLDAGYSVLAVERGENMTAFVRNKFRNEPAFSALCAPFQDYGGESGSFDLVYSASAFHWIPEETGYRKVYDLLKPGGVFARFANHPYKDKSRPALDEAIQRVYARYMPGSSPSPEYTMQMAQTQADIAGKYGFTGIEARLYHRVREFTAKEYVSLLGTYSDHHALDTEARAAFFAEIEQTILDAGGHIAIYDTIDLELAQKPQK